MVANFNAFIFVVAAIATSDASRLTSNASNFCTNGIVNGNACCDRACGQCGGDGCSGLKGGAAKCCAGTIISAKRMCANALDTGCLIAAAPKPDITSWCEHGIVNDNACCPKSCGQCGGKGCPHFPGGQDKCCSDQIKSLGKPCKDISDIACVVPQGYRPKQCSANAVCAKMQLPGNCCPRDDGTRLACCDQVIEREAGWCHKGIQSKSTCCDPGCGRCGGSGCGGLPGGSSKCCDSGVAKNGKCKTINDVACMVPDEKPKECSAHPRCAALGLQGNCCPNEHGSMLDCCDS